MSQQPGPTDELTEFRTVIRGGTIVTAEGDQHLDLVIDGDTIVALLADARSIDGDVEINAHDLLILPGMVDAWHPTPWLHDLSAGHLAHTAQWQAFAGGITTIGAEPGKAPTDVGVPSHLSLDAAIWLPVTPASIPTAEQLARMKEVGLVGLTLDSSSGTPFDVRQLETLMRALARHDLPLAIQPHHPAYALHDPLGQQLASGTIAILAADTGAWIYLHDITSPKAVATCITQREQGARLSLSVPALTLSLSDHHRGPDEPDLPIRTREIVNELWEFVAHGYVDCVSTTSVTTTTSLTVLDAQTALNLFWHEAVHNRNLTPQRVIRLVSTNPARVLGISHHKGAIRINSDADLVLLDQQAHWKLNREDMIGGEGIAALEGHEFTGMVTRVLQRGRTVYDAMYHHDDRLVIPGTGHLLHRQ